MEYSKEGKKMTEYSRGLNYCKIRHSLCYEDTIRLPERNNRDKCVIKANIWVLSSQFILFGDGQYSTAYQIMTGWKYRIFKNAHICFLHGYLFIHMLESSLLLFIYNQTFPHILSKCSISAFKHILILTNPHNNMSQWHIRRAPRDGIPGRCTATKRDYWKRRKAEKLERIRIHVQKKNIYVRVHSSGAMCVLPLQAISHHHCVNYMITKMLSTMLDTYVFGTANRYFISSFWGWGEGCEKNTTFFLLKWYLK